MLMATVFVLIFRYFLIPAFQDAAIRDARDILYRNIDDNIINIVDAHLKEIEIEDIIKQRFGFGQELQSIVVDSIYLNRLCTVMSRELINRLESSDTIAIPVPLTKLLGFGIVYHGPSIYVKLNPNYSVHMSYSTSVADAGGKKTKYRIILKTKVQVFFLNSSIRQSVVVDRQLVIFEVLY